jgi:hypothetical protein
LHARLLFDLERPISFSVKDCFNPGRRNEVFNLWADAVGNR